MSIRKTLSATAVLGVAILFSSALECDAEIKIQFLSTYAKNNVIPDECLKERKIILPLMLSYDHPANWTWIIACDEHAWDRVEVHMGQVFPTPTPNVTARVLAITDLETRVTYIRGFAVLQPFTSQVEAQPEHTIAHELSHIILNSHNETIVEDRTRLVMQQHATQARVVKPKSAPVAQ
jgi:hypothetical protein